MQITIHDDCPADAAALIDKGLGQANDLAAPLHEVRAISCFVRLPSGQVVGGAVGRTWGACCELQQLWVEPEWRRQGLGAKLVRSFETRAHLRGCTIFYLETFNFQAPELYRALGYQVTYQHAVYPHGIVKYIMVKREAKDTEA